jgi:hypothetical protein
MSIWPTDESNRQGQRLERVRGLCFSVLYDLCAWLAAATEGVPANLSDYSQGHLRGIPDPRQRMQHYVHPHLLATWDQALRPFFAAALRLDPVIGPAAVQRCDGLDGGTTVRVEYRFENQSALLTESGSRQSLAQAPWVLTLWITQDLQRVDDATLRPLATV